MNNNYVTNALARMTFAERRRYFALVRTQRINTQDAVRVIERERNREAITADDVRDCVLQQRNRRTVVGALA